MLTHLTVRDLAVVDNVELELGAGLTALTGETGAGKSLIVDALELVIGARASADMVRSGATSAHITAVFETSAAVNEWLGAEALDDEDGACVLRRVIGADGRSRAFINARAVPVSQLRAIGERLVDVHGQHSHQALLKGPAQRDLLDAFIAEPALLEEVAAGYRDIVRLDAEIASLGGDDAPLARLDFLRYQLEELHAAPIESQALDALEREHRALAHAEELRAAVALARAAIDGDDGAACGIAAAIQALEAAARIDARVGGLQESLRDCAELLSESDAALREYGDGLQSDDARLRELDAALAKVHDLARKHRVAERDLHRRQLEIEAECSRIEGAASRLAESGAQREAALARFSSGAQKLSAARTKAALRLAAGVNEVLGSLGMQGAAIAFEVAHDAGGVPARHGLDRVTLLARTNPGQAPLPLAKIASGGELSRIALAVHAVALDEGGAATVVFDEVDAGVGGAVAEILGRRMRELGEQRQVLTVTHLPQVAACAHHHAVVRKQVGRKGARTGLEVLDRDQRERELARMLGGVTVTHRTLDHAREMLDGVDAPAADSVDAKAADGVGAPAADGVGAPAARRPEPRRPAA